MREGLAILRSAGLVALLLAAGSARPLAGQSTVSAADRASVSGLVTTQGGTVRLPGATVTAGRPGGVPEVSVLTSSDGRFRLAPLGPGTWVIEARLAGFEEARREVTLVAGGTADLALDLPLQGVTEQVVVAGRERTMDVASSLGPRESIKASFLQQSALSGDSLAGVLAAMPGVIATRGGLSIRGGRPVQSRTLLDSSVIEDPFTGVAPLKLPVDAISSIDVMPTPYAVEFGGFSSGVTQVTTRQGSGTWRLTANNLDPSFRGRRGKLGLRGLRSFAPRIGIGGPIIKTRLSLATSVQYRYTVDDVQGRPESDVATTHYLSSATRLDASLAAGHTLAFSLSLFPENRTAVNLDSFTPPSAAYNQRNRIWLASATDSLTLSKSVVLASSVGVGRYGVDVYSAGAEPMILGVEGTAGNYFSTQSRQSTGVQWSEVLSAYAAGAGGEHMLKAGFDLSHGRTRSSADNRPILVTRADGTTSSEIRFGPPRRQSVEATSVGLFAQDRWQPVARVIAEFGVRFDRDGVLRTSNLAPRGSVALALDRAATMTVRGGAGLFFERSPLNAAAFEQLQTRTVTRYDRDGATPLGLSVYSNVAMPGLRTPRSVAWNVAFDWKVSTGVLVHAGHLERTGRHDLVVEVRDTPGSERLELDSTGRSKYRETEAAVSWSPREGSALRVSYVRSSSEEDLNPYSMLFGAAPEPLIRRNEYGRSPADVPHRLVGRAHSLLGRAWFLQAAVEWRSGLPYSLVNEDRVFVGPRNQAGRFPAVALVDLAIERRLTVARWKPWFGLRVSNVFNTFAPLDVQANTASPACGGYSNSVPRRFAMIVRLHR